MKQLLVLSKTPLKFDKADVYTFDEIFVKFKKAQIKQNFRTFEAFQWLYDSGIAELKTGYYVYPFDDVEAERIKKYYKVIEENNVNF